MAFWEALGNKSHLHSEWIVITEEPFHFIFLENVLGRDNSLTVNITEHLSIWSSEDMCTEYLVGVNARNNHVCVQPTASQLSFELSPDILSL
jgi:hypothetical protein